MDTPHVVATWIHTIAFVIAWGYFGVLGRIVLPGLELTLGTPAQADALRSIERRAVPLLGLSVALFTITGTWLLVVDPAYAGLGDVLASSWTALMFAKHGLIVALVLVAVAIDRAIRRLGDTPDAAKAPQMRRIRMGAEAATALGALIALATAAAQAAA